MDPTPGPANFVEAISIDGAAEWWLFAIIVVALFAVGFLVIFVILRASEKPAPTMLVVTLAMLTMITIIGFLLVRDTDLLTLAGVGLGALAGAVSTVFQTANKSPEMTPTPPPPGPDEPDEESSL